MSEILAIQEKIEHILEKSCLNRFQIKKAVSFQLIANNQLSLKVDLHGLNLEETKDIIERLFNTKKLPISVIELVHGYKRGTVLKDYIEKDFRHDRLDIGRHRIGNEGVTILYLKPWDDVLKEDNKPKTPLKKAKTQLKKPIEQSEADLIDQALFRLSMIKEKVKVATIDGAMIYEAYQSILNQEQLEMMAPLLVIALTKEEFLLRIFNLYVYQGTMYVDVNINKLQLTQVTNLLNKLVGLKSDHQIVLLLRHRNKRDAVIKAYINTTLKDKHVFDCQMNEDHTLTTITIV